MHCKTESVLILKIMRQTFCVENVDQWREQKYLEMIFFFFLTFITRSNHRSVKCAQFLIARKKLRANIFQLKYGNFNSAICWIIFMISKMNVCLAVWLYSKSVPIQGQLGLPVYQQALLSPVHSTFFFAHQVFLRKRC